MPAHLDLDAGVAAGGDRHTCLGTRRVDDADQGVQRQLAHPGQQVASGIELLGRNHPPSQRQHAQRLLGQCLVLGDEAVANCVIQWHHHVVMQIADG